MIPGRGPDWAPSENSRAEGLWSRLRMQRSRTGGHRTMTTTVHSPEKKKIDSGMAATLAAGSMRYIGKPWNQFVPREQLQVISIAVRDRAIATAVETKQRYVENRAKRACYS